MSVAEPLEQVENGYLVSTEELNVSLTTATDGMPSLDETYDCSGYGSTRDTCPREPRSAVTESLLDRSRRQ